MDPRSILKKARKADVSRGFLSSLRKDLVRYMAVHPAVSGEAPKSTFAGAVRRFAAIPAFVSFIAVFAVTGTVFASQGSLPGDTLYPIKLLSEQVQIAAMLTPGARSRARLAFAAMRVDEASKLVQESTGVPNANLMHHAALRAVLDNFNVQVAGAFAEARGLQEQNNASGALAITNEIKTATDGYKAVLASGKEKAGDGTAQDIDQFIDTNNEFNDRADAALSNASGTGEPTAGVIKEQDGVFQNRADAKGLGSAGGDTNRNQQKDSVFVPMSVTSEGSNVSTSIHGQDGQGSNHGGGDGHGNGGDPAAHPQTDPASVDPISGIIIPQRTSTITSTSPASPASSSLNHFSSSSSIESSSSEPTHGDLGPSGIDGGSLKNTDSSGGTNDKNGTEANK